MFGAVVGNPEVLLNVVGWLLLAITLFVVFSYGLRAFPGSPAVLLASLSERFKIRDAEAQTGYRQRFKQHFKDVCEALQPRTMLIFIDDLDRCAPAKTAEMLEAVNYLVNSGPCIIVLGMARDVVEAQLAFQYKDLADVYKLLAKDAGGAARSGAETTLGQPDDVESQRLAYVRSYLRKLINLEVRVPRLSSSQILALLELEKKQEETKGPWRSRGERWAPVVARWAQPAVAWVLVLCIAAWGTAQVMSGFERWHVARLKQVAEDRQLAVRQIGEMRELERETVVAVDYARGREKRLATDLFHKYGVAVAGLEFRLPIETLKAAAESSKELCPDASPGAQASKGKSNAAAPLEASPEFVCWQEQAREVEGSKHALRTCVTP